MRRCPLDEPQAALVDILEWNYTWSHRIYSNLGREGVGELQPAVQRAGLGERVNRAVCGLAVVCEDRAGEPIAVECLGGAAAAGGLAL